MSPSLLPDLNSQSHAWTTSNGSLPGLSVEPLGDVQRRFIRNAVGQILAVPVIAPAQARELRMARLTGYALRRSDLPKTGYHCLRIAGLGTPVAPFLESLEEGECLQVHVGALLPRETDCLVPIDRVEQTPGGIVLRLPLGRLPQHWAVTELIAQDAEGTIFRAGHPVAASDLGILAALGCYEVTVRRPLRVGALFLRAEHGSDQPASRHDESHRINLYGALARLDVEISDLGSITDFSVANVQHVLDDCDLLLVVGGISGPIVSEAVQNFINPIRTMATPRVTFAYGAVSETLCLVLPHAPLSVMVAFQQWIRPLVSRLRGEVANAPLLYTTHDYLLTKTTNKH